MSEKSKVKDMIEIMNKKFQTSEINRINNSITNPLIDNDSKKNDTRKRTDTLMSNQTVSSINSKSFNNSFETMPFNEEKDLDLPYFSSTKYNSLIWRLVHGINYLLYGVFLFGATLCLIINQKYYNTIMIIAHSFFFISSFIQWFHYRRGCIGKANLNSGIKNNIDKSCKARLLRSEEGFKYFFSLIGSLLLIYGNIYFYIFITSEEQYPEFWNVNLIGNMIISLSQILKLEKILTENKSYVVKNDISNCFVEIFLFFGSLFFGGSYYIQIMYNFTEDYNKFLLILKFIGNGFIVLSGFCLIHRYFLSDYDDLNVSDLSNVTI